MNLGTIFSDSPLGLDKWLPAVWLVANSKNGMSSHELRRSLLVMQTESFLLSNEVEVDETFIGGKARNMHKSARERKGMSKGGGSIDKTPVLRHVERGGRVPAEVINQRRPAQPARHGSRSARVSGLHR